MKLSAALTLFLISTAHNVAAAQTEQAANNLAPIVRTERASAGVIQIVYNLQGAAGSLSLPFRSKRPTTAGRHSRSARAQ